MPAARSALSGGLWIGVLLAMVCQPAANLAHAVEPDGKPAVARWQWELPPVALQGVPVDRIGLSLVDPSGQTLPIDGRVTLTGLTYVDPSPERSPDGTQNPSSVALTGGTLVLSSDRGTNRRLMVTGALAVSDFTADGSSPDMDIATNSATASLRVLPGWISLLPPVIAILLAVWCREVVTALLAAVTVGMCLLTPAWWLGPLRVFDMLLIDVLADRDHLVVILFTLLIGGMIGGMSHSGGTAALVARLVRKVETRERGQLLTWLLGLLVFFDDYANTMIVGGTMRPVADRLRFSRAKLAFLVDSTAAPVAGLALISTWVGVELGYIEAGLETAGADPGTGFAVLVSSLPYRLYPLLLLLFVGLVAFSGRDFGPMLRAELRLQRGDRTVDDTNAVNHPADQSIGQTAGHEYDIQNPPHASGDTSAGRVRDALLPVIVLVVSVGVGLCIAWEQSAVVLLLASAAAALTSVLCSATGRHSLAESVDGMVKGMQSMLPAVMVMVLAWSLAEICDTQHLNTAGFLVESPGSRLDARWLPAAVFLLSAAIAFATGTSFGTMGLLMPMAVLLAARLPDPTAGAETTLLAAWDPLKQPVFFATVGSVLAGSIFGDHCSPVSDTTVLSSAASGCDHLEHVATQLPYALTVAGVSVVAGLIPAGFGVPIWLILPVNAVLLVVIVYWLGQRPDVDTPADGRSRATVRAQPDSSSLPE